MTDPASQGQGQPGYPPPGYQSPPPGYPPPGYPGPPGPRLNYYAEGGTSKAGVLALVFGILGLFLIIPAFPAVYLGLKGIREGRVTGRGVGLSIGGLILGGLVFLLLVIGIVVAIANA